MCQTTTAQQSCSGTSFPSFLDVFLHKHYNWWNVWNTISNSTVGRNEFILKVFFLKVRALIATTYRRVNDRMRILPLPGNGNGRRALLSRCVRSAPGVFVLFSKPKRIAWRNNNNRQSVRFVLSSWSTKNANVMVKKKNIIKKNPWSFGVRSCWSFSKPKEISHCSVDVGGDARGGCKRRRRPRKDGCFQNEFRVFHRKQTSTAGNNVRA